MLVSKILPGRLAVAAVEAASSHMLGLALKDKGAGELFRCRFLPFCPFPLPVVICLSQRFFLDDWQFKGAGELLRCRFRTFRPFPLPVVICLSQRFCLDDWQFKGAGELLRCRFRTFRPFPLPVVICLSQRFCLDDWQFKGAGELFRCRFRPFLLWKKIINEKILKTLQERSNGSLRAFSPGIRRAQWSCTMKRSQK